MAESLTVNGLLDSHVALDIECLDRLYLNGYVPNLQVGGQVASFMTGHLGYPIPTPAIMEKMGTAFRHSVTSFAVTSHVPVVRFHVEALLPESVRHVHAAHRVGHTAAPTTRPMVAI